MANIILFTEITTTVGFSRYAGAYRIASDLRKHGYTVQVVDFFQTMDDDTIIAILKKFCTRETLWIGFASSLIMKPLMKPAERLKAFYSGESRRNSRTNIETDEFIERFYLIRNTALKINSRIKFIIGGYNSKFEPITLPVDFWVHGPADQSVLAITEHLKRGAPLKSTAVHDNAHRVISTNYEVENFPQLTIDWHPSDYIFPGEHLPIEVARGCIFRCSFCAHPLTGKKAGDYTKPGNILKTEIIRNYEQFGTTGYFIVDDTINDRLEKVQMLHEVFTNLPFKPELSCYARIDLIYKYPEMRELLFEMGVKSIFFGIESFHPVAAKKAGKGLSADKVKKTLYYCKELWRNQVLIGAGFIVGLSGEPEESILETFDWLNQDNCPIDVPSVNPLHVQRPVREDPHRITPFSKIGADPLKYGYKLIEGAYWKNEHMDKDRAIELIENFQIQRLNRKERYVFSVWLGCLRNLGYTFEDLIETKKSSSQRVKVMAQAVQKYEVMRQIYTQHLLTADTEYLSALGT